MTDAAIGVFDSGLGGLTAVRELMQSLPDENIIYFGDTGRVPYGTRSDETVIKYACQDIRFLMTLNIKAVLVACGTVSAIALPYIETNFSLPVVGVVKAAASAAARSAKNRRVAVIATPGTVRSGAYARALGEIDADIEVISAACPLFVPLVENGRCRPGDLVIEQIAREYLEPVLAGGPGALILGCTHYPLLKEIIAEIAGPNVALIDAGAEAVSGLKKTLESNNLLGSSKKRPPSFFVSDNIHNFTAMAEMFLDRKIDGQVAKIDIEAY